MKTINTAIIGFGVSGAVFHAPMISSVPGFLLTAIVTSKPDKVIEKYPNVIVYSNSNSIFNNKEIELVIISVPTFDHFEIAKNALLSGKHVVIEKPFVLKSFEGEELIKIAKQKNLFLSVFQNRRWDNGFLTLKKCIKDNLFGNILSYEAYFDRFRPLVLTEKWKEQNIDGSGILYDLGVHLIDQALHLFGMPDQIFADTEMQRHNSVSVDYFKLILKYSKMRVTLGASSVMAIPRPIFAVNGTTGSLVKFGLDPQEEALRMGKSPNAPNWGEESELYSPIIKLLNNDILLEKKIKCLPGAYQNYYIGIYNCIVKGDDSPVSAMSALDSVKIIELASESAINKKWIVIE